MDYEEKYNEALKRAKDLHDNYPYGEARNWWTCEKIFPELKESEDKRIREALIKGFQQYDKECKWGEFTTTEILSWLKKQGGEKEIETTPIFRIGDTLKKKGKDYIFIVDRIQGGYYHCDHNAGAFFPIEEQDNWELVEQKPTDKIEHKFKVGDIISNGQVVYRVDNITKNCIGQDCYFLVNVDDEKNENRHLISIDSKGNRIYVGEITWLCEQVDAKFEKQDEHKPTDKIEPKFKVRDWIVQKDGDRFTNGEHTIQVTDIENDRIWFTSGTWLKSNDIRHWTIQDAKDGDVLVTKRGIPFIYDKNRYDNGLAYYYVALGNEGLRLKTKNGYYNKLSHLGKLYDVHPATKEERAHLFAKMEEAGYEWDADKKELKKII